MVAPVVAPVPTTSTAAMVEGETSSSPEAPWTFRPGGFLQPEFRENEYSPTTGYENGFRFARARFTGTASGRAGDLELSAYFEAELQPSFSLYDAYMTVRKPLADQGYVMVDFGQTRLPISRQQMMSDTRLSFVDKAQINTIAPDRDLGTRVWLKPPKVKWVRVIGGVFNGEGRNQVQNIDQHYFYAGRVEITPFGGEMPLAESAFNGDWFTIGASLGRNVLASTDYNEDQLYAGYDISGSWHGVSASFEYLQVNHSFDLTNSTSTAPENYHANGFMAQLTYLLPWKLPPVGRSRFEIGARVEEIDRNDAYPITMPGDPNQSEREYTLVLSYYIRKHNLKAQLAANHYTEIENQTVTGADATFRHDQLLLQVTYRVE